jgi:ribosome-binding protein aMBF1 (putative translation factor)
VPKSDIAIAFASVVKKHRNAKGMSQELLAEKADVHPIYIGYIERSVRNPTIKIAKAIANALGLSLAEMIAEAEQIQKKRSG